MTSMLAGAIGAKIAKRDVATANWSLALLQNRGSNIVDEGPLARTVTITGSTSVVTQNNVPNGRAIDFDGTNDYLSIANAASLDFGTGDFQIEAIFIPDAVSGTYILFDTRTAVLTGLGMIFIVSGSIRYFVGGTTRININPPLTIGTKYHVLLARNSGTTRLFLNGSDTGLSYADTTNYNGAVLTIGDATAPGAGFDGRMAQIRVCKGFGRSANFTPPTAVLGRIS